MKKIIILTAVILLVFTSLSFAAQKTITTYMRSGDMSASFISKFPDDYVSTGTPGAIIVDSVNKTITLGNGNYDSSGSFWYGGDSDIAYCIQGKCVFGIGLRAYFEFTFKSVDTSSDSTAKADGFGFAIANGSLNSKTSTGGAPAGISIGELMGYAGPGRSDGLGLRPPKMLIEFDTFPNGSGDICSASSRNDDADNHVALMFWGDNPTGNCKVGGVNYPKATFDDNRHGAGSGTNPVNSYKNDSSGGYYSVAKGSNTYNWLEDGQLHRFRIEITRANVPSGGNYSYNIKAWVDCASCSATQLNAFKDLTVAFNNDGSSPKIIRTVLFSTADHQAFDTMLFGWTEATGGSTQTTEIKNFDIYFPRSSCTYGINPISASYGSAANSGTIAVLTGTTCGWTAVSSNATWLTISAGSSGTGSGTVTYNITKNTGAARTATITITGATTGGTQVFTLTQTNP